MTDLTARVRVTAVDETGRGLDKSRRNVVVLGKSIDNLNRSGRNLSGGGRAVDSFRRSVDNLNRTTPGLQQGSRRVDTISRSVNGLKRALLGLLGINFAVRATRGVLQTVSAYQALDNRIRTVARTEEAFNRTQGRLLKLAQDTNSAYAATVESFSRLAASAQELGRSQEELFRVQETLNKAVALGGSTSVEGAAGLRQFAQGLASGRLQGDELRSVLENLLGVSNALVDGLNKTGAVGQVTRGSLRTLAAEGQLTSGILIDALLAASENVDTQFGRLNRTLGQSATRVRNAGSEFVGQATLIRGGAAGLGKTLDLLADNFSLIANVALVAATTGLSAFAYNAAAAGLAARNATTSISAMTAAANLFKRTVPGLLITGALTAAIALWQNWGDAGAAAVQKVIDRLNTLAQQQRHFGRRNRALSDSDVINAGGQVNRIDRAISQRQQDFDSRPQTKRFGHAGRSAVQAFERDIANLRQQRAEIDAQLRQFYQTIGDEFIPFTADRALARFRQENRPVRNPHPRPVPGAAAPTAPRDLSRSAEAAFNLRRDRIHSARDNGALAEAEAARKLAEVERESYRDRIAALDQYAAQNRDKSAEIADRRLTLSIELQRNLERIAAESADRLSTQERAAAAAKRHADERAARAAERAEAEAAEAAEQAEQLKARRAAERNEALADLRDSQLAARTEALRRALNNEEITEAAYADRLIALTRERYANQIADLREQGKRQLLEQATINVGLAALEVDLQAEIADILDGLRKQQANKQKTALKQYAAEAQDQSGKIGQALVSGFRDAENALTDFVRTGKLNFTDFANSIVADLLRIAIQKNITGPLAAGIGAFFSGGSAAASSGPPTGLASGGPVRGGNTYLVGERGPELFVPQGSGRIVPNNALRAGDTARAGTGIPNVRVVINNQGAPQRATAQATPDLDGRGLVVNIVTDDIARNGPISQALGGHVGLNRRVA